MRFSSAFTLLLLLVMLNSRVSYADVYAIRGCISGCENSEVFLNRFYGDQEIKVDSAIAEAGGCFTFQLESSLPAGQYRLIFSTNRFLDLIFNHEDISFNTSLSHLIDSMNVTGSEENDLYYQYLKFRLKSTYRLRHLKKLSSELPIHSERYRNTRLEIKSLEEQEKTFIQGLIKGRENTFAAKLIRIDIEPHPDPASSQKLKNRYIFSQFMIYTDYSDSLLLYTNALSAEMISYLSLVPLIWPQTDSVQYGFRLAAFNLLIATGDSEKMYGFVKNYLINGFNRLGYTELAGELHEVSFDSLWRNTRDTQRDTHIFQKSGKKPALKKLLQYCADQPVIDLQAPILLVISKPNCILGANLEENLHQSLKYTEFSQYQIIRVFEDEVPDARLNGNSIVCNPGAKALKKMLNMRNDSDFPLLVAIDAKGHIEKTAASWVELLHKTGW